MESSPLIYLASRSPRRQELLRQIGVHFELLPVDVDESLHADENPETYARRLALDKARAGRALVAHGRRLPVLGADTAVVVNGRILGKPADRAQALEMLQLLSGNTHRVISAVAVKGEQEKLRVCTSNVTFRTLSTAECQAYWETQEPVDKAGAYAIQGLAALFVTRMEGSYSGVMGLPLFETGALLEESGISLLRDVPLPPR